MVSRMFAVAALVLLNLVARAGEVRVIEFPAQQAPGSRPEILKGYLAQPAGAGPFATVIALHGCGGLSQRFIDEMTQRYTSWGYLTLVVDSFANHPVKFACGEARARSRADDRPRDAIGAVRYLAALPQVDPARIALVGSSQGSWVAMQAVRQGADARVRAVVAYYPDCRTEFEIFEAPVLILTGALDDWNPPQRCEQMQQRRAGRGAPVQLVVYPDARHGFDWPDLQPARRVAGYLMQYHEPSAVDALARERDFLGRYIGQTR